jgi:hypothetical protein
LLQRAGDSLHRLYRFVTNPVSRDRALQIQLPADKLVGVSPDI